MLIGSGIHVVGDDAELIEVLGVVLLEERLNRIDDDRIFVIGWDEDEERWLMAALELCSLATKGTQDG